MTHPAAELLRAIAEGKQMECSSTGLEWGKCSADDALIYIGHRDKVMLRIARPMVTRQVTYPEPLRVKPNKYEPYFWVSPAGNFPVSDILGDAPVDNAVFAAGMAFATEADAAEAHRALFGGGQ